MATAEPAALAGRRTPISGFLRSPSLRLVGIRLLQAIPVFILATFLAFALLNLLPGSAASNILGEGASQSQIHALEIKLHLNEPFWERYWNWLIGAAHGDLGTSLVNGQPVREVVMQRFGVSLQLVGLSLALAFLGAVIIATISAKRPRGIVDRIFSVVTTIGQSLPGFVLALALIFVLAVSMHVLPAIGYVPFSASPAGWLDSMIMPVLSMSFLIWSILCRTLRADLIDQQNNEDYVQTARAKGAAGWSVLVRHTLRNSIFGLITLTGLQLGSLIGTTAITEQIFGLPGLGQQLLNSINSKDVPMVLGIVVVMVSITVVANLIVDLLYTVLDPRIRHDNAA